MSGKSQSAKHTSEAARKNGSSGYSTQHVAAHNQSELYSRPLHTMGEATPLSPPADASPPAPAAAAVSVVREGAPPVFWTSDDGVAGPFPLSVLLGEPLCASGGFSLSTPNRGGEEESSPEDGLLRDVELDEAPPVLLEVSTGTTAGRGGRRGGVGEWVGEYSGDPPPGLERARFGSRSSASASFSCAKGYGGWQREQP